MSANKGNLLLLKVGDGGSPAENFTTVGGLRNARIQLNNRALDHSGPEKGSWQALLSGAGRQSLVVQGSGLFTDTAAEEMFRGYAFARSVNNYEIYFGNGDHVAGPFMITAYERSGEVSREENFRVSLISAGEITYQPVN